MSSQRVSRPDSMNEAEEHLSSWKADRLLLDLGDVKRTVSVVARLWVLTD